MKQRGFSVFLIIAMLLPLYSVSNTYLHQTANLLSSFEAEYETNPSDTIASALEQRAQELLLNVTSNNKFIGTLASNTPYTLPVGLRKSVAGVTYTIVLDGLMLDYGGASLKAYMILDMPGSDQSLGFYADNVRIGPSGIEAAELRLIQDKTLHMGAFSLVFRSALTKVTWDCDGYHSTSIGGDVIFPSSLIKPLDNPQQTDSVMMGGFQAVFTDINDVILSFNMQAFQVNGLPGFEFHPQGVFIDLSDTQNPTGVQFPADYFPAGQPYSLRNLWRGIYIPSFTVKLPGGLDEENQATTISAQHMLIDHNGITGAVHATQILALDKGKLAGWKFSVDEMRFKFFKNSFTNFMLKGEIKLPISSADNGFSYAGMIDSQGDLSFFVSNNQVLEASLWGAELVLDANSHIQIERLDGNYFPSATLHGSMSIGLDENLNLGSFLFQDMVISNQAPYITIGNCEVSSGLMSGFPVSVSDISFLQQGDEVGLSMTAAVNFVPADNSGFGASGSFTIWAQQLSQGGFLGYEYKRIQYNAFTIDVNQGAFKFFGSLELYNEHAIYGKGFKGMIDATFHPGINVSANAQFGNVDGFRYWYVDALLSQPAGITIFPGVAIYGFGGGASYRMKLTEPASYNFPPGNQTTSDNSNNAGVSLSGATYLPDSSYGLGLKASVIFGTQPNPKAVNGTLGFRIQFYSGGGIQSIRFNGDAVLASEIGTDPTTAYVRLVTDISYNFGINELYGYNEAFVDMGVVKGINPNNSAGQIIFLFNPDKWYVHMGRPDHRIGLKVLDFMQFSSYFMVGTEIPPFPAPPANVDSILRGTNVQSFEAGLLSTGSGFAFGSAFNMDTGDQEFLIFYGSFSMGAGFDIMLKDYGANAYCDGFAPPLGINGWYAMGQAYAYVSGEVGVNFRMFGKNKKVEILKISAAALLQAKMPNPIYFAGEVGGQYNVLGGLVKGNCNFRFSMGDDCEVTGASPLGNISVIADITPSSGSTDVSVFITPQVAFNYAIDQPFELVDLDNNKQQFRIKLEYFRVMEGNTPIPGQAQWNTAKDVVSWETTEIYPEYTQVSVEVGVVFQRKHNNTWVNFTVDGQVQREQQTLTFTTGARPDHIEPQHVEYMYPVADMMNFHWEEYPTGYMKLTHNYAYLLNPETGWTSKVIFDGGDQTVAVDYAYNSSTLKVAFSIPTNLQSQRVYQIRLAKQPTQTAAAIDANVVESVFSNDYVDVTTAEIEGLREVAQERVMYKLNVRTSLYSTFSEKMNNLSLGNTTISMVLTGIYNIIVFASIQELFDPVELNSENPLIELVFEMNENAWFNNYIHPLVYHGYPRLSNLSITVREPGILGLPPVKATNFSNVNSLTIPDLNNIQTIPSTGGNIRFRFEGPYVMYQDYNNLLSLSAAAYTPGCDNASVYEHIINGFFQPILLNQTYQMRLRYRLPGTDNISSEKIINCEV